MPGELYRSTTKRTYVLQYCKDFFLKQNHRVQKTCIRIVFVLGGDWDWGRTTIIWRIERNKERKKCK